MCKESIYAKNVEDAKAGQNLIVSVSTHGLPAFHPEGQNVADCVTCVKDGTMLTLNGIPPVIQVPYDLTQRAVVTFIDKGDNQQDMIRLKNGREVPLMLFANKGVRAYVGVLEMPSAPEDDLPAVRSHRRRATIASIAVLFAIACAASPFVGIVSG